MTGKKKSGKSYFATRLSTLFLRVIIWDYNWEHTSDGSLIVHNLNELKLMWQISQKKRIAYQPYLKTSEVFEELCKWVNDTVRYCCFYVEELQNVESSGKITDNFQLIMDSGRHLKIGMLLTSRGLHHIPTRIPDSADYIIAFKQQRKETWEYLKDHLEPVKVDALKEAPMYYFLILDGKKTGETYLVSPISAKSQKSQ